MHRFDFKKLNDAEVKEQYKVKIWYRFAALDNSQDNAASTEPGKILDRILKYQLKTVSLGHYKSEQYKPWFDEGCSKLLDRRAHAGSAMVAESKPNK